MEIEGVDVQSLPLSTRKWLASAMAGMICADGHVDGAEMKFLKQAIGFLDNTDQINALVQQVRNREKPVLKVIKMERETAFNILKHLTRLAVSDTKLSNSEADFLKYAAMKLGFDPNFANHMMRWARQQLETDRILEDLWKMAQKSRPHYQ